MVVNNDVYLYISHAQGMRDALDFDTLMEINERKYRIKIK